MNNTIGQIRIGAKIDIKQMEKDLNQMQRELEAYDKENEKLLNKKAKVSDTTETLKIELDRYEHLVEKADEYLAKRKQIDTEISRMKESGTLGYSLTQKQRELAEYEEKYKAINVQLEREAGLNARNSQKYEDALVKLQEIEKQIKNNTSNKRKFAKEVKNARDNLEEAKKEQQEFNEEQKRQKNIQEAIEKSQKKLFSGLKKLVAGIIGVRGAYSLVRKAVSSYMASHQELTKQVEAFWTGLGEIIGPLVEWFIKGLKKLVTAVLYFAQCLTGVNYIEKANASILKKQKQATDDLTKSNNKLSASFDEIEVLDDNTTSSSKEDNNLGASLFDLNDVSENVRKKLEALAEYLKIIYDEYLKPIWENIIKPMIDWALKNPEVVMTILGAGALISFLKKVIGTSGINGTGLLGIYFLISAIAGYKIGKNIESIIESTTDYFKASNQTQGGIDLKMQYFDNMLTVLSDARRMAVNSKDTKKMAQYTELAKKTTKEAVDYAKLLRNNLNSLSAGEIAAYQLSGEWDKMQEGIAVSIQYADAYTDQMHDLYNLNVLNEEQTQDYYEALMYLNDTLKEDKKSVEDYANAFNVTYKDMKPVLELTASLDKKMEDFTISGTLARGVIGNLKDNLKNFGKETDTEKDKVDQLNSSIKKLPGSKTITINTKYVCEPEADKDANALALLSLNAVQGIFGGVSLSLSAIRGVTATFRKAIGLAQGGIINNPGKGVPLGGNIIGGEAGPEAVLPLNQETMSWLAQLIASNMVVNLTNVTTMNGRQISKELKQISANENYAFNV